MTDTWNPTQYDKFQREREQPFFDLLSLVQPAPDMRAVDLGCGTGRLTRALHEQLHARQTIGIDRSPRMLGGADTLRLAPPELVEVRARSGQAPGRPDTEPAVPGLTFEEGTIEAFPGARGAFDLIFSNAALHWVEDHPSLLARLASALNPSGQLAFQVPAQHDQPSHRIAEDLTDVEPFRSALNGWHRPQPVLEPHEYATLLYGLGFKEPVVRLNIYPHVLAEPEEVVEWMKGTLLTEYERHLPADLCGSFVEAYRSRMLQHLRNTQPLFFPFRRILCWGRRSA
jgi:trans-aconitate 2-methyltransferase